MTGVLYPNVTGRLAVMVALTASLAACATPEMRLRDGLYRAGLSKPVSACMAERMVDRLSLLQLRRISALQGLKGKRLTDLPMDEFLHKVRALKDPEILGVTTSSAAVCAVESI